MSSVGTITVIKRSGKDGARLEWDSEKSVLLIGRHEDCDIRVQLPTVSRRHATFEVDPKTKLVMIKDHSAVNRTKINDKEVSGPTVIQHGNEITVGDRKFRFEYVGGSTPAGEVSMEADSENMNPNAGADLEGDATQHLSKFVRVAAPRPRTPKPTLPTVQEAAAPPAAPAAAPEPEAAPAPAEEAAEEEEEDEASWASPNASAQKEEMDLSSPAADDAMEDDEEVSSGGGERSERKEEGFDDDI
jgi:antigen KI-67